MYSYLQTDYVFPKLFQHMAYQDIKWSVRYPSIICEMTIKRGLRVLVVCYYEHNEHSSEKWKRTLVLSSRVQLEKLH